MSRLIDSLAKEEDTDDVPVITKPTKRRRLGPEPIPREILARAWAESEIARLRANSFTIDFDTATINFDPAPSTSEDV